MTPAAFEGAGQPRTVQFHPESILTASSRAGHQIIAKADMARVQSGGAYRHPGPAGPWHYD